MVELWVGQREQGFAGLHFDAVDATGGPAFVIAAMGQWLFADAVSGGAISLREGAGVVFGQSQWVDGCGYEADAGCAEGVASGAGGEGGRSGDGGEDRAV